LDTAATETRTNFGGYFQLTIDTTHHLLISKEGYKTSEVKITSTKFQVSLAKFIPDPPPLSEEESSAISHYVYKNITFPSAARKKQTQGRVYVSFDIDYAGKPQNIKILQDVGDQFGESVARTIGGVTLKPSDVNRSCILPITFLIQGKNIQIDPVGMDIALPTGVTILEEVVLVGYGEMRKL
jgi:TonB family protein